MDLIDNLFIKQDSFHYLILLKNNNFKSQQLYTGDDNFTFRYFRMDEMFSLFNCNFIVKLKKWI